MKLSSLTASKPVFIFFLLTTGVLLLPSIVVPWWYTKTRNINHSLDLNSYEFGSALLSQIENTAKLLDLINASAINLGKIVSSSFNGTVPSAFELQRKVAPLLFHALTLVPQLTHAAYIGLEGPFFSYYYEGNQTFAMYSQSTSFSNETFNWYKQPVKPNTGNLQGNATKSDPFIIANASWIQEAINRTNHGYASLTRAWNNGQDLLILNTVSVHGQGVISLGFPVKALINFFTNIDLYGGSLYLATGNGDFLAGGLPDTRVVVTGETTVQLQLIDLKDGNKSYVGEVSCVPGDGKLRGLLWKIGEIKYIVHCSTLDILGVPSVYVLALPHNQLAHSTDRSSRIALILLIVMITGVVISVLSFVLLMIRATSREIHLCSALINQMEATQQAERKSMNKSLAFATASHDIRAALAGITGLIDICYELASPGSELETSLKQMDNCAKDLVGLLNSVLDTSKIEAGKMQLEEEEFDLACLLEDVVDLYHPVGLKKGVDIVLDSYDGSILKFCRVKGDRGKLKQILCNLLSNAVKFTSEGHVSVRAWAQEPCLQSKIIASNQNGGLWRQVSCLLCSKEEFPDMEALDAVKQNPSFMEFFFEVDDTGQGIPKEKQKSVFENFVQVKETGLVQGGTGLGLGIVQSLVRLMGGEIIIVDKENGKKGTCFRFNVFLSASATLATHNQRADIETGGDSLADSAQQYSGLTIKTHTPSLPIRTTSPRLHMLSPRHRTDCSHVFLLIQDEERRRTSQKFMESLGIKVSVVRQWERLHPTLMKIKSKFNISHHNSAEKLDWGSRTDNSSSGSKDVPLNAMDGIEQNVPSYRSSSSKGAPSFVLLVIDAGAGPFRELCKVVTDFKRGLHRASTKVVWLDKPSSRSIRTLDEETIDTDDEILLKPFHGCRLYQVIKLLPEFGGTLSQGLLSKSKKESKIETKKFYEHLLRDGMDEQAANYRSRKEKHRKKALSADQIQAAAISQSTLRLAGRPVSQSEIEEQDDNPNSSKPLSGMKFLVVDDSKLLRMLTMTNLKKLGADVELCVDGQEALELVRIGLHAQREHASSLVLPYDYILMDCEMPIMDGYEATRRIRREEIGYGVHIPIIALTAHISGDEAEKMTQAGMDARLGKPLEKEKLLGVIKKTQNK